MKKSKFFFLFVITFIALLFIVFIYQKKGNKIVINLWDYPRWREKNSTDRFFWIKKQIKKFQKKYPEVKINFTPMTWNQGYQKLLFSLRYGNAPDIFPVNVEEYYYFHSIAEFEDLTPILSKKEWKDFDKNCMKFFEKNGKIYVLPFYRSGIVLFVNKTYVKRYHIPLNLKKWDINSFYNFVRSGTIDLDNNGTIDIWGFAAILKSSKRSLWPFLVYGDKNINDSLNFSTETFRKNIKFIYKLTKKNILPLKVLTMSEIKVNKDFFNGKFLCYSAGLYLTQIIEKMKREGTLNYEFDILPYPSTDNLNYAFYSIAGYSVLKQKKLQKRKYCFEFLRQLYKSHYNYRAYKVLPVRNSHLKYIKGDEFLAKAYEIFKNGLIFYPHPYWSEIDDIVQRILMEILFGNLNIDEGISKIQHEVNQLLEEKGEK